MKKAFEIQQKIRKLSDELVRTTAGSPAFGIRRAIDALSWVLDEKQRGPRTKLGRGAKK